MKFGIILLLLSTLLGFSVNTKAQAPVANFTADKIQGCPPSLFVQFTDASTGTITSYSWDFGNGNTSTEKNPGATFVTDVGKIYTVTLTVYNGSLSSSKSITIRIFNAPKAEFSGTPLKGCTPHTVSFSDKSTKGDGTINDWKWDFRDGSTRTTNPASYTYNVQKKHTVYLKVTDSNGCSSDIEKADYVDVAKKPEVYFTPNPASSCKIPQVVTFTNNSTGLGTLLYDWSFGNGKTSTLQAPQTTYEAFGSYNVRLKVTSTDYNCDNSFEMIGAVKLTQIKAAGLLQQNDITINNNDTICSGSISFTNQSIGSTIGYWDFGDGTPNSTLPSGTHSFNNPGKYTVKLIASPGNTCSDTAKWVINVEKAVANFTFDPTSGCVSPIAVNFDASSSTGANSFLWEFHDNTSKTGTVSNFTYTIAPNPDPDHINTPILYPITLTAYSKHGCASYITKSFSVNLPTALFSTDKIEGCLPLTVNFTDHSLPNGNIASRKWEFGDNTSQTTTGTTGTHIYNSAGTYKSKLVVTDKQGCVDTSYIVEINVGKISTPDFQVTSPLTFYSDEPIHISDLTPPADNIDYWDYSINGVSISKPLYNVQNPIFTYDGDSNKLTIKLRVGNSGCYSEKEYFGLLTCLGPFGSFTDTFDCPAPLAYRFKGTLKDATSFEWDFGDGNKNTTDINPTHTFLTEGDKTVKFITHNNGHYNTFSKVLKVRLPDAQINSITTSCSNDGFYLLGKNSYKIPTTLEDKYHWTFGDNTPDSIISTDSVFHAFSNRGTFNVRLVTLYENGCTDSAFQNIRIYSPYAKIQTDVASGCDPLDVNFTDISTTDGASLSKWEWNFANGKDSTLSVGGHQISQKFVLPNNVLSMEYPVVLKVTDVNNCVGFDTVPIQIAKPTAQFAAFSSSNLCHTDSLILSRSFLNPDSVVWSFGDGQISRNMNKKVGHKYNNAGNYKVELKLYKYNCVATDSTTTSNYIKVQKADASFTVSDSVLNCTGEIKFKHTGIMSPVDSGRWYFGDRGNTGLYDTVKNYNYYIPGTFTTKLKVHTSFGCADTVSKVIQIKGPYADFAANPRQACKGDTVLFELRDTSNLYKWEWDFGEGIIYKNADHIKYVFRSVGKKNINMTVYSIDTLNNCKNTIPREYNIEEVIAQILTNDTSVCANDSVKFTNLSVGNTYFNWDLGNGSTPTENNPTQNYQAGLYTVKLMVGNNDNGCKDTATQEILVNPIPQISLTNDTVLCAKDTLQLQASGGNVYFWSPATGLSATNGPNPLTWAQSSIKYFVHVTIDSTACAANDSINVKLQEYPVYTRIPSKDTTIFIGDEISLKIVNPADEYIYTWNPLTGLICNGDCSEVTVKPTDVITYYLTVKDLNNCFTHFDTLAIDIRDTCTFDVAKAFTPGGTEANRILKVQGKGIKELVEFKIYNRWGNVVFQSNDLSIGWDGIYQGKEQPVDTYIYTITVMTYKGFPLSKKGTVLLIR